MLTHSNFLQILYKRSCQCYANAQHLIIFKSNCNVMQNLIRLICLVDVLQMDGGRNLSKFCICQVFAPKDKPLTINDIGNKWAKPRDLLSELYSRKFWWFSVDNLNVHKRLAKDVNIYKRLKLASKLAKKVRHRSFLLQVISKRIQYKESVIDNCPSPFPLVIPYLGDLM